MGDREFFQRRWTALLAVVLVLAVATTGVAVYAAAGGDARTPLVSGLAGTTTGVRQGAVAALWWELALIGAYIVSTMLAIRLGRTVFYSDLAKRITHQTFAAPLVAGVLDVGENLCLAQVLARSASSNTASTAAEWARIAQALALTKVVVLAPALLVAGVAIVVTGWRLVREQQEPKGLQPRLSSPPDGRTGTLAWQANRHLPKPIPEPGQQAAKTDRIGICVSGGGIRSAVVALGALQVLRERRILQQADYLVSVSGGGYATGALRLALQDPIPEPGRPTGSNKANPDDVFAPGSPEFAYLRRHGKYLADGALQWCVALGTILRGLLTNLALFALLAAVAGRMLGHFYAEIGLAFPADGTSPFDQQGFRLAVIGTLAVAALLWFAKLLVESGPDPHHIRRRLTAVLRRARTFLIGTFLLSFTITFLLPAVIELSGWVLRPAAAEIDGAQQAVGTGAIATAAGYVATLAGIYWRHRTKVKAAANGVARAARSRASIPQLVVVYAGLAAFVAALLLVFGRAAATAGRLGATIEWPLVGLGARTTPWAQQWLLTAALGLVLVVLGTVPDQIRWSLHPFYRRRLASAFAVRRLERDGRVEAVPYDYDLEETPLHEYAKPLPGCFPQLIFSAAANVSGADDAPPGRRVLPFTFSFDYVGGPGFGWARTSQLASFVQPVVSDDLTVQSSMAVSGAAFASAMGRFSTPFSVLFALTNARLGTWLPNPRYLQVLQDKGCAWYLPKLPTRRRLPHVLREILGSYCANDTMLLLSDGGHYENLGLVELLRRDCRTILCIDASGDDPALAETLAQAVMLAREELGLEIQMRDVDNLLAGSGAFSTERIGMIGGLTPRLAQDCAATGTVDLLDTEPVKDKAQDKPQDKPEHRPETSEPRRPPTRIVFAKTALTRYLPDDVLAYAARNPRFPCESTSDQWFDHGQFDAYHELGRHTGEHLAAAFRALDLPRPPTTPAGGVPAPA